MAISTNTKPTIYRNLYENTGPRLTDEVGCVDRTIPSVSRFYSIHDQEVACSASSAQARISNSAGADPAFLKNAGDGQIEEIQN